MSLTSNTFSQLFATQVATADTFRILFGIIRNLTATNSDTSRNLTSPLTEYLYLYTTDNLTVNTITLSLPYQYLTDNLPYIIGRNSVRLPRNEYLNLTSTLPSPYR